MPKSTSLFEGGRRGGRRGEEETSRGAGRGGGSSKDCLLLSGSSFSLREGRGRGRGRRGVGKSTVAIPF